MVNEWILAQKACQGGWEREGVVFFSPSTHMRDQRLGGRDGKGPSLGLEIDTARDTEPNGRLKGPRLPYSIAGPGLRGEGRGSCGV